MPQRYPPPVHPLGPVLLALIGAAVLGIVYWAFGVGKNALLFAVAAAGVFAMPVVIVFGIAGLVLGIRWLFRGQEMGSRRVIAAAIILLSSEASAADEAKDPRVACGVAAVTEYNKATLALMNSALTNPSEIISVETQITRRHLQENYCLKLAHCLIDGSSVGSPGLALGAEFSECLKDEAAEK
jgi:hypothetical protein